MTDTGDDAAEKPLDPATERLRRRLVRLLALSVSTLLIGVMAVLGAIVYKLNRDAPPSGATAVDLSIALPAGSTLVETIAAGDTALLRLRAADDGAQSLVRVDLATGAILARYRLDGLAPATAGAATGADAVAQTPARPVTGTGTGAASPLLQLYRTP